MLRTRGRSRHGSPAAASSPAPDGQPAAAKSSLPCRAGRAEGLQERGSVSGAVGPGRGYWAGPGLAGVGGAVLGPAPWFSALEQPWSAPGSRCPPSSCTSFGGSSRFCIPDFAFFCPSLCALQPDLFTWTKFLDEPFLLGPVPQPPSHPKAVCSWECQVVPTTGLKGSASGLHLCQCSPL